METDGNRALTRMALPLYLSSEGFSLPFGRLDENWMTSQTFGQP
jgi:hypothetical protein